MSNENYKSRIGHHSSYISETKTILNEYSEIKNYDALVEKIIYDNILNKASESYRRSILNEITRRYIPSRKKYEETPLIKVLKSDLPERKKKWILYYEFCEDKLVYKLVTDLLFSKYKKKNYSINKDEVIDYLDELSQDHEEIKGWSENTIQHIAEHFLSAVKNFGLLEGSTRKKFKYLSPPKELISYVLYSIRETGVDTTKEIINHDDWKLFMMDKGNVRDKMRKISPGYINYEKRGNVEQIDFNYESLEECIDEF